MKKHPYYRFGKIFAGVLLALLLFFFVALERLIPRFIDMGGIRTKIEQSILDSAGIRADIRELRLNLTLFDGIEVMFDNNVLYDPKDIKVVDAGQILVNIRYMPLILKRQTSISRIAFNNIALTVGEKGFLLNMKKQEATTGPSVVLEDTRLEFNNYKILVDRFFDGDNKYYLHGDYLTLKHYNSKQPLILEGTGTGFFGREKPDQRLGRFRLLVQAAQKVAQGKPNWRDVHRFRIQLEGVELPTLASITQAFNFPLKAEGLVGKLGFDYKALPGQERTFSIFGNTDTKTRLQMSPYHFDFDPGRLTFDTKLDLNPEDLRVRLSDIRLDLHNPDFNGQIRGNTLVRQPFDQSQMDLTLNMSPLSLTGLDALPILPEAQRRMLGTLEGKFQTRMHIWGLAKKPNAQGTLALQNMGVRSAKTGKWLMDDVNADIRVLSAERFQLADFHGQIAGSAMRAKANIDTKQRLITGLFEAPKLDLDQLKQLGELVMPESPLFQQFGLTGQSDIQLEANGHFDDPRIKGLISFSRVRLIDPKHQRILLHEGDGSLVFRNQKIEIPDLRGRFGAGQIRIHGWMNQDQSDSDLRILAPNLDVARLEETVQSFAMAFGQTIAGFDQINLAGYAGINARMQGSFKDPKPQGVVRLNDVSIDYLPKRVQLTHMVGPIWLTPEAIRLDTIRGRFRDIPFTLAGTADTTFKRYLIHLNTPEIAAVRLTRLVSEFAPQMTQQVKEVGLRSGTVRLAMAFSPIYPGNLGGMVYLKNLVAVPTLLKETVQISRLQYDVGHSRLVIPDSTVAVGSLRARVRGYFATDKNYNVAVTANNIPVSYFRDNRATLQRLVPTAKLPTLYNTAGSMNLVAQARPGINRANIRFNNAGLSAAELKFPVYDVNGQIALEIGKLFKANTRNLRFTYANSPASLSLTMPDQKHIRTILSGNIHPLLSNDLLPQTANLITGMLPFNVSAAGAIGQFTGSGAGNDLTVKAVINPAGWFTRISTTVPPVKTASLPINPMQPSSSDIASSSATSEPALSAVFHLVKDTLNVEELQLLLGENNGARLIGQVQHVFLPKQMTMMLSFMTTPELDLGRSQQALSINDQYKASGRIRGNANWNSGPGHTDLQGKLEFDHVASEFLELQNLTGTLTLEEARALFDLTAIQIPGLDTALSAAILDVRKQPLPVTNFRLAGRQFILESVLDWVDRILNERLEPYLAKSAPAYQKSSLASVPTSIPDPEEVVVTPKTTGDAGTLPFEILDGVVSLKEVIVNNIVLDNFNSNVQVAADQSFALNNLKTDLAEGHLSGTFSMAPSRNNQLTAKVAMDKISASALSHIFMEGESQIFGDISGTLDLTTEGKTPDVMMANANANAKIRIEDGRLPQIARVQNLIMATSSLVGGGFSNFSLNNLNWENLAGLVTRYQTDYFATMTGTFTVVQGVLHTDDLLVDGSNLDFQARGDLRLKDSVANMSLLAQFDRDAGGALGSLSKAFPAGSFFSWTTPLRIALGATHLDRRLKLGRATTAIGAASGGYELYKIFSEGFKLSVGSVTRLSTAISSLQLLKYLPVVRHTVDRIPGLGYVPGIGPLSDKGIEFGADIIGPISDPGSIKNIRWGGGKKFNGKNPKTTSQGNQDAVNPNTGSITPTAAPTVR